MTQYTSEQIEEMLDELKSILSVRVRYNSTFSRVDVEIFDNEVIIEWGDHFDREMRRVNATKRTYFSVHLLQHEIESQKEKLFEDIPEDEIRVLQEVLNHGMV